MEKTYSEEAVTELARRAYESGEARFEIASERCALLVIDMQDEWVRPHWSPFWIPGATQQVPLIKQLIEHCRSRGIPVIYTVFSKTYRYLDRPVTGPLMPNRHPEVDVEDLPLFVEGKIWHELAPQPDDFVIHKPSYGAFFDTPLETILRNLGRDTVIICGAMTNLCCSTTARQAYERSLKVVFGSDVNATNDPVLQEAELKTLRYGFARVLTAAEIMAQLR